MFSHPCDAATPNTAGFKVITLMPDENGYPDLEAMKAAPVSYTHLLNTQDPDISSDTILCKLQTVFFFKPVMYLSCGNFRVSAQPG